MSQCKVFVIKFSTIYRLSTGTIVVCEITTLAHLSCELREIKKLTEIKLQNLKYTHMALARQKQAAYLV